MSELYGLKVLISDAVESGTLHILAPPPSREDFDSDEDHWAAYDRWWQDAHCWKVEGLAVPEREEPHGGE